MIKIILNIFKGKPQPSFLAGKNPLTGPRQSGGNVSPSVSAAPFGSPRNHAEEIGNARWEDNLRKIRELETC